jgi:hypothetical protein
MNLFMVASICRRWLANKKVLGTIGFGVTAGSLVAVSWLALRAFQSDISLADVSWMPLAGSFSLQVITLLALPVLWGRLLEILSAGKENQPDTFHRMELYKAYSRSWLARYIPGRIWMLGGRMVFAAKYGVPAETVARSMVFEMVFTYGALATLGVSLILAANVHYLVGGLALIMGGTALTLAIAFTQNIPGWDRTTKCGNPLLKRLISFVYRIVIGGNPLSLKHTVWGVGVYGTFSCLQLLFIVVLAESFADLTLTQAITIAGAWGIGSVLGYFAFIAPGPGGLGIRDGITLLIFAQVIDISTAGLVVAVSRVIMITADVVFVGIIELTAVSERVAYRIRGLSINANAS